MSLELINMWYVVAAALFVFGLKQLGSPATAVRGNMLSSLGMLMAVAATLFNAEIISFQWIIIATVVGGLVGALVAQKIAMTSMPEMVALFNGSGGIASLLVGWAALYSGETSTFTDITILISVVIGGMTFSGSILAWGKLSEVMNSAAIVFSAQRFVNALILVDLQNDFTPGGALPVPEGDSIVPLINQLQQKFDLVVATQDWHPSDHQSFAVQHEGRQPGELIDLHGIPQVLWPIHCVQETEGAQFISNLDQGRVKRIFRKGQNPQIDSYSGFFDNDHQSREWGSICVSKG